MAPSRPYFARLDCLDVTAYVPIVRDPQEVFRLDPTFWTLDPWAGADAVLLLDDSVELMGTQIVDDGVDRPATLGDLRAGRAADVYWEIRGGPEGTAAFWKTMTAVRWPGSNETGNGAGTATFAFTYVIQADVRKDVTKILDSSPVVLLHARKFRETVLKTAKEFRGPATKKRSSSPAEQQATDRGPERTAKQATDREPKKIDLERTDKPVDFSGLFGPGGTSDSESVALPDTLVRVSAGLYGVITYGCYGPEMLRSDKTYLVRASDLEQVAYSRIVDNVVRLERLERRSD